MSREKGEGRREKQALLMTSACLVIALCCASLHAQELAPDQKERVDAAVPRIPVEKMLYLEADEEGNPRRSFDVNLLQARLLLADLYPLWSAMCQHYGVDAQAFNGHFTPIRNELFAHIQGGVDRRGRDFTTIYYGTEAH